MNQTLAGLLVAASLAVGLCAYRRYGLPATPAVFARRAGLFALLLLASQLAGYYTPRAWARAVARYPRRASGLGVAPSTER
jgi:hypothetical protein